MRTIEQQIQDSKKAYIEIFEKIITVDEDSAEFLDLQDDLEMEAFFLVNHCYGNIPLTYRELYNLLKLDLSKEV